MEASEKPHELRLHLMTKTLVILAAGIGSRSGGGVKQLTSVDDNGHLIIDYSIRMIFQA